MGRLFAEAAMVTQTVLAVAFIGQLSASWIIPMIALQAETLASYEGSLLRKGKPDRE